ncbi:hypothetical protein [Allorhizobium undicola]|uniref:hypothetical protein n=1 Tax=Allorhizobium undicola TaxID=78527 RepID=UPI0004845405|nr:hypothetical protein [Allorhizobium undicola]
MTPAFYADYIAELRALFSELDQTPELFQTFDLHIELLASGSMVVYETRRKKGVTDSLYYGRSGRTGASRQLSRQVAFTAIDRFFSFGEFLALAGSAADGQVLDENFPSCAVKLSYRKKGHPKARSMLMVFIGFNDQADALSFAEIAGTRLPLIATRPFSTDKAFEWR